MSDMTHDDIQMLLTVITNKYGPFHVTKEDIANASTGIKIGWDEQAQAMKVETYQEVL